MVGSPKGKIEGFLHLIATGHGDFKAHLFKIGKIPSKTCVHCNLGVDDDVTHTLEICLAYGGAQ